MKLSSVLKNNFENCKEHLRMYNVITKKKTNKLPGMVESMRDVLPYVSSGVKVKVKKRWCPSYKADKNKL